MASHVDSKRRERRKTVTASVDDKWNFLRFHRYNSVVEVTAILFSSSSSTPLPTSSNPFSSSSIYFSTPSFPHLHLLHSYIRLFHSHLPSNAPRSAPLPGFLYSLDYSIYF